MPKDVKCPICGSETVKRTAQKGPNAGQSFHVCILYPECKGKVPAGEQIDYDMPLVEPEETKKEQPETSTPLAKCDEHPERDAVATCVNCGKGICKYCKTVFNGQLYCPSCMEGISGKPLQDIPGISGKSEEETVSVEIITGDTPTQAVVSSAEMQEYEIIKPFISAYEPFLRRPWTLTLEFPHSSSKALPQVLKLAKLIRGFTETQEAEGTTLYRVSFEPLDIGDFNALYKKVKNWKGTLIYINDEIVSQADVSKWLICYRDKVKSLNSQPLFCWGASSFTANIFGCHRTKIRDSDWNWNGCWYSIGELDMSGIFHIDKNRIVAIMIDNLKPYYICPALNPEFLVLGLKIIPNTINPRQDKRWEYVTLSEGKPIGVRPMAMPIGGGYEVPISPQYNDLMALLEHKLKMGAIEVF